ncbi:MAG: hypothetical protein PUP91_12530 [Rhizonema sp. PD37]|nr:hypothetical protein [Rhizonema sp. PD37]
MKVVKKMIKNKIIAAISLVVSASVLIPIPTKANSRVIVVQPKQSQPTQTTNRSTSSYNSTTSSNSSRFYQYCVNYSVPIGSSVKQCTYPSRAR